MLQTFPIQNDRVKVSLTKKSQQNLDNPVSKRNYVKEIFAVVAPRYRFITHVLSFGQDARWKKILVSKLSEIRQGVILDIACGPGDIAKLLLKKNGSASVIGCDISHEMISRAGQDLKIAGIKFMLQDMDHLSMKDNSINMITGGYALRNAPELRFALAEAFRVLKPGGIAAYLDFSRSPNRYFSQCQYLMLKIWGGLWGLALHRNPDIYGYLADSLCVFPDRTQLKVIMKEAGFIDIESHLQMFGMIEILFAKKPKDR